MRLHYVNLLVSIERQYLMLLRLFTGKVICVMFQLSYAIGVAEPLSIFVSSYGTGVKTDAELLAIVKANFDLRPGKIVK